MNRLLARPLAASLVGHGVVAVLLVLFAGNLLPMVRPPPPRAIEIMLAPPPPPVVKKPPPPPPVVKQPPPPPPVVKKEPPPPPPPVAKPKPPPPRPRSKPVVVRRPPPVRPEPRRPPPVLYRPPVERPPPPQTAAIPRPPPPAGPVVSNSYRRALGIWIRRHKFYPEAARRRGLTGHGVLRFHVDRSGRVLDYAVIKSTGHRELDAAMDQMMRGARLPPFPADMTASDIEVSVTIRFALGR